ncbi:hypothetical protein GYMLUDRAFT_249206 [Collybiopsis luxurians FD-317 M1]|uniref:Uncharacterized protein n=1 Tax=Collybiopsis luxurians FD-317 M1 TaxID=944289 RepID=A0A0D0CA31_9AGAR|nr:hypothetical protein GYMLUDRAFT_249206 [Collybiopsis luxurians FD-317 M1]
MTPEEQALLATFGQQTLLEIIDVIISSFFYGMCLLGACLLIAWIRPSSEQGRSKVLITSFIAILVSFTWDNVITNAFAAIQARYGMMEQLHQGLEAQGEAAAAKSAWWYDVNPWPAAINVSMINSSVFAYVPFLSTLFLLIQTNTSPVVETFYSSQLVAQSDTITEIH